MGTWKLASISDVVADAVHHRGGISKEVLEGRAVPHGLGRVVVEDLARVFGTPFRTSAALIELSARQSNVGFGWSPCDSIPEPYPRPEVWTEHWVFLLVTTSGVMAVDLTSKQHDNTMPAIYTWLFGKFE